VLGEGFGGRAVFEQAPGALVAVGVEGVRVEPDEELVRRRLPPARPALTPAIVG
jgi:hypothetical protein